MSSFRLIIDAVNQERMKADTAPLVELEFNVNSLLCKPVVPSTLFGAPNLTTLAYVIGMTLLILLASGLYNSVNFSCFLLFPTPLSEVLNMC